MVTTFTRTGAEASAASGAGASAGFGGAGAGLTLASAELMLVVADGATDDRRPDSGGNDSRACFVQASAKSTSAQESPRRRKST